MISGQRFDNDEGGEGMTRLRLAVPLAAVAFVAVTIVAGTYAAGSDGGSRGTAHIAMLDNCDPSDLTWNEVGGCALRRGTVSTAEFDAELDSPLAAAVVGHQSWRNEPSYLSLREGKTVRVVNRGGRPHTFTEVANFGGGKIPVPPLNEGLVTAPECPGSIDIAPGDKTTISGLTAGTHRFMCCIHPWMRANIEVSPDGDD
jgi:plastocyanin